MLFKSALTNLYSQYRTDEKISLIKFISIYFFSTSFFIILLGYLYFSQQKNHILQKYTMKMHEYSVHLKQTSFTYTQEGYSFIINQTDRFQYKLATKEKDYYIKSFPINKGKLYLSIHIDSKIVDDELLTIKYFTILLQIGLLLLFLTLSYILAKISLKPLNDTISHLDRFIKDLIHDLNTPSTAIILNSKMLEKSITDEKQQKKLKRIQNSANTISSLYENLEILLNKDLEKVKIDLYPLLEEKQENCKILYPNIQFQLEQKKMIVFTNEKAISRIIDNILSNGCKYSQDKEPYIKIWFKDHTLYIKDNGKGMQYPQKIFERSYRENENGHGIGMHIVHRLSSELDIKVNISSKEYIGTTIIMSFKN